MQKLTRTNKYPEPQKKKIIINMQHNITDFGLVVGIIKQYWFPNGPL